LLCYKLYCVVAGLKDSSAYVRRHAIIAKHCSDKVQGAELQDIVLVSHVSYAIDTTLNVIYTECNTDDYVDMT